MATRGRKPKPTALKVLEGNPGKRPLNASEPVYDGALGDPPAHLTPDQCVIWRNVLREAAKGLLKTVDEAVVAQYCISYDILQKCNASMAAHGGPVVHSTVVRDGIELQEVSVAPEVQVIQKQHVVLVRAASEMGFTPSSRSRLHLEDPKDPSNPFENL
jgi:P27 family predicted phage terminase small subunit